MRTTMPRQPANLGSADLPHHVRQAVAGRAARPRQHRTARPAGQPRYRPLPGRQDGTRAALTPTEARQLAAALLRQAAAAEPDGQPAAGRVEVSYLGGQRHEAATRGRSVLTYQPAAAGTGGELSRERPRWDVTGPVS